MNKYFRYLLLTKLQKKAAVYDSVKSVLEQKGFKAEDINKPVYGGAINIPSVGAGIFVKCPDNPIINGKYNVFFQIRSGYNPTKAGINTILVEAEAGGKGSSENTERFGNSDWIKKQLGIIQMILSKKFGNVSLGKLGLGSFSGGYDAVGKIIADPTINDKISGLVILDGIHYGKRGKPDPNGLKPWVDFANKVKDDPTKKMVIVHTSVDPGTYASSTDTANYINKNVGAQKTKTDKSYNGIVPASISNNGGYTAIQLYDQKDPNKFGYGYTENEMKSQHIQAAKSLKSIWGEYLKDWNT